MITPADIKSYRHRELAQIAKRSGIAGWHSMRKAELVAALLKIGAEKRPQKVVKTILMTPSSPHSPPRTGPRMPTEAEAKRAKPVTETQRRIQKLQQDRERLRDISEGMPDGGDDRLLLMVRDPYWLQTNWEISSRSIERAHAALAEHWHGARPVLRLTQVVDGSHSESIIRVIPIHGGVRCWYIEAPNPPSSFRVEIGYLAHDGRFHGLARSNLVTTPQPGTTELMDVAMSDVAQNSERIFAMSGGHDPDMNHAELREWLEARLHRPLGGPAVGRFGPGGGLQIGKPERLPISVDAEMIIYGSTDPDAFVTISAEPVKLQPDGSFSARVALPERRQIIPIMARSKNGTEERTIVLAVERNTKVLEPRRREPGEAST